MKNNIEINALISLLDDPDNEVHEVVSNRILSYGIPVISNLESYWETTADLVLQERIEELIHNIHFDSLYKNFNNWKSNKSHDLLEGLILAAKFHYPDLKEETVYNELNRIKRAIWLELNQHLTILEKINVLSNILFQHIKLKSSEINYNQKDEFLISKVLESKNGNAISNGLLMFILSKLLEINLQVIGIPNQFILAAFSPDSSNQIPHDILFFIDGTNGRIYSYKDIQSYFSRIQAPERTSFYAPLTNRELIINYLIEFSKCYSNNNQERKKELLSIVELLKND
ncbi:MAG: transglutaminase family protein [Lacibacter sp.]